MSKPRGKGSSSIWCSLPWTGGYTDIRPAPSKSPTICGSSDTPIRCIPNQQYTPIRDGSFLGLPYGFTSWLEYTWIQPFMEEVFLRKSVWGSLSIGDELNGGHKVLIQEPKQTQYVFPNSSNGNNKHRDWTWLNDKNTGLSHGCTQSSNDIYI